jgi:exosortase/archaeosortase family protein
MGEMKKRYSNNIVADIILRYLSLLLLTINDLWIFYFVFTPITVYLSASLLGLFFYVSIYKNSLLVNGYMIDMVKACIAGAAYYFLLILNLTTRDIKLLKRIKIFLFSSLLFLILNIARIFFLVVLRLKQVAAFDVTHLVFWYGISTIYVVLVWIATIRIFNIKEVPFYSDFMLLKSYIKNKKGKQIKPIKIKKKIKAGKKLRKS